MASRKEKGNERDAGLDRVEHHDAGKGIRGAFCDHRDIGAVGRSNDFSWSVADVDFSAIVLVGAVVLLVSSWSRDV